MEITIEDALPEEGKVLFFNKPKYWTSFQLVGRVRYLLSRKYRVKKLKCGHAGTLDPLASGVMIVCIGKATKRIESFQNHSKEYIATLRLGATTPSFDEETPVNQTYAFEHITKELFLQILETFKGEIEQIPPIFSACKVEGKRAYKMAKEGEVPELRPKKVTIHEVEILKFSLPEVVLRVSCSKGTYIRSLARDLGIALQSGAYLTDLIRTKVGEVELKDCLKIEEFLPEIKAMDVKVHIHSIKSE
ncbi:MAG TPA: tRNA pseudouridine(55) synthase TruB [Porphyromonadaceae bacterium]|nr:tRNA pseudouridine(55) synthase TruB [Porphyromonadaceae bacterium]